MDYESLSNDEKSEGYVFHILSDFVSDDSRQKLNNLAKELSKIYPCEIRIHICDDSVFEGMPKFRGNNLAFYRVLIPNFMPKNLKLCLYLDIDMLVHSDLRELFSLDLENKYAGVVEHCLAFHILGLYAKNLQDKDYYFMDFYFNSGFLLFNLNAWQKYNLKHKVLDFATRYNIICPDQDALNGVIRKENALVLPYEYNMLIPYYYPCGILWNREGYITRFPHTKEQMDFAHSNPIIWHYLAESKPYKGEYFGTCEKGKVFGLYWWQTAWNTPFFSDELKALFATKRDNYLVCKEFGLYVASLINECSKGFAGYLKMPFVVYRAFSEFDLNRNYANDFSESIDKNVAFELLNTATRMYVRKNKFEQIIKMVTLPFRIYRTKNRCKKGIYKAQKGNVISRLYVES